MTAFCQEPNHQRQPFATQVTATNGAEVVGANPFAPDVGLNHPGSVWSTIAVAPIFVWELSLGIYLVVKGFKPSPITAID